MSYEESPESVCVCVCRAADTALRRVTRSRERVLISSKHRPQLWLTQANVEKINMRNATYEFLIQLN